MSVEIDRLAVVLLAEGGVAGVAHLLDHGRAVGVDGDWGGRDAVGDAGLLEGAVEVVEGFEFALEGGVLGGREGFDVFCGFVEGDGEEEKGVWGGHGCVLGVLGVCWGYAVNGIWDMGDIGGISRGIWGIWGILWERRRGPSLSLTLSLFLSPKGHLVQLGWRICRVWRIACMQGRPATDDSPPQTILRHR